MKRTVILALGISICSCFTLLSKERTKPFELEVPEYKVENSLYNNIEFLDSRRYKDDLGYIQTGLMNSYAYLVDEVPFTDQFNKLISQVTDETSQGKTLLLQLRNLNFSEITKAASETGYCHIRISLFEKEGESAYHEWSEENSDHFFVSMF